MAGVVTPLSDDRLSIEDALFRRAGQLAAYFGRYDMYALALENVLTGASVQSSQLGNLLPNRGSGIARLLKDNGHSAIHQFQFHEIDEEFLSVLNRNRLRASNPAVIPTQHGRWANTQIAPAPRDWFDHDDASDEDVLLFIVQMERDIATVGSLYLRVAAFVIDIQPFTEISH